MPKSSWTPLWFLLLLPYFGLLYAGLYNKAAPDLFGFPFFYWYQLIWVPVTSIVIYIVYRSVPDDE